MKTEKCCACGANVEVIGDTTKSYKNLDKVRIEELEEVIKNLDGADRYYDSLNMKYDRENGHADPEFYIHENIKKAMQALKKREKIS